MRKRKRKRKGKGKEKEREKKKEKKELKTFIQIPAEFLKEFILDFRNSFV